MNIFGAFTFGSLIKTFIPGFVLLIAVCILAADIAMIFDAKPVILEFVVSDPRTALVLAIPASILFGLLSNIVVFMGVTDLFIRRPAKKSKPSLFDLYDLLATQIRKQCWDHVDNDEEKNEEIFHEHVDAEYVMLQTIGIEKMTYLREQYWFHLEFQINLLFSIVILFISFVLYSSLKFGITLTFIESLLLYVAIAAPIGGLLFGAARKNYERHISKMVSLMASVLRPSSDGS